MPARAGKRKDNLLPLKMHLLKGKARPLRRLTAQTNCTAPSRQSPLRVAVATECKTALFPAGHKLFGAVAFFKVVEQGTAENRGIRPGVRRKFPELPRLTQAEA